MNARFRDGKEISVAKIHAISTGLVKVRLKQIEGQGKGFMRTARIMFDKDWSEWLPIYVWVIDHEEGIIVVDTGETSRVHEKGYHPSWHPFFRRAAMFSVQPEEEIGPQLRAMGIKARDVRHVVITHLHTDHAGGLVHLSGAKTWVAPGELRRASGFGGKLQGYLPHRWPKWWTPEPIHFQKTRFGPFQESLPVTKKGDVLIIPTPGHTPHHVSVVVCGSPSYFLAGDTSYDQAHLLADKVDGVSPDESISRGTMHNIVALAKQQPLVYLPSHDREGAARLAAQSVLIADVEKKVGAAAG
jgi:N-acyl homoserine lactone hydrolase